MLAAISRGILLCFVRQVGEGRVEFRDAPGRAHTHTHEVGGGVGGYKHRFSGCGCGGSVGSRRFERLRRSVGVRRRLRRAGRRIIHWRRPEPEKKIRARVLLEGRRIRTDGDGSARLRFRIRSRCWPVPEGRDELRFATANAAIDESMARPCRLVLVFNGR